MGVEYCTGVEYCMSVEYCMGVEYCTGVEYCLNLVVILRVFQLKNFQCVEKIENKCYQCKGKRIFKQVHRKQIDRMYQLSYLLNFRYYQIYQLTK